MPSKTLQWDKTKSLNKLNNPSCRFQQKLENSITTRSPVSILRSFFFRIVHSLLLPHHSWITAYSCISKAVTYIREKYEELPLKLTLHVWRDGWETQLHSCSVFSLMSCYDRTFNMSRFYNKLHHGKGPMYGVGETIKSVVSRDVKSGKCTINSLKEFAEYANKSVESIATL